VAKKKIRYVFGADVTELERGMKRVEYKLGKLSANAQRFGSAMTRNVTTPLVGLGALARVGFCQGEKERRRHRG